MRAVKSSRGENKHDFFPPFVMCKLKTPWPPSEWSISDADLISQVTSQKHFSSLQSGSSLEIVRVHVGVDAFRAERWKKQRKKNHTMCVFGYKLSSGEGVKKPRSKLPSQQARSISAPRSPEILRKNNSGPERSQKSSPSLVRPDNDAEYLRRWQLAQLELWLSDAQNSRRVLPWWHLLWHISIVVSPSPRESVSSCGFPWASNESDHNVHNKSALRSQRSAPLRIPRREN